MKIMLAVAATTAMLTSSSAMSQPDKPTILLVHGAFADASSWNGVIGILEKDGYGDKDKNIPPQALAFMAERASSKQTDVVRGASHVVMVSNPKAVANMIERAAAAPSATSASIRSN